MVLLSFAKSVSGAECKKCLKEHFYSPQAQLIQPWLDSQNCHERKAALVAVAVMSEGCALHIKST